MIINYRINLRIICWGIMSLFLASIFTLSAKADTNVTGWLYYEEVDKLRDKTMYTAILVSINKFTTRDGREISLAIILGKQKGKAQEVPVVVLGIANNWFECSQSENNCNINVRFDKGPIMQFSYEKTEDFRQIIINNSTKFLSLLKNSKYLIIEANIFNTVVQFEFNIPPLKWPFQSK